MHLASTKSLSQLSKDAGGLPAIVVGSISGREGHVLHLKTELVHTDSEISSEATGGTAILNESEWAMLGRSVAVSHNDYRSDYDPSTGKVRPVEETLVENLDDRSRLRNPVLDPSFPFRVRIFVDGEERRLLPGTGDDQNTMYVGLRNGEVYNIKIEYLDIGGRSDEDVFMRLLVDGLNTLPEKLQTKGVETWEWGKRVNLAEARTWRLNPTKRRKWTVSGFYTSVGPDGRYKEFNVVDAEQSLAARHQFTDQIGLITAAFYAKAGETRSTVGTAAGAERQQKVRLYKGGGRTGKLLGVVHLRYVSPEALP